MALDTQHATLRRSVRMWQAYAQEQSRPQQCYTEVAADSVSQLSFYAPLTGSSLLDIGGGPGYFADAFRARGVRYAAVDADAGEFSLHGRTPTEGTVQASGLALPFADNTFDITYSSNVVEHVSQPWELTDEMVRVTRPGGVIFVSYTVWLGPHGGHETSYWHYFGGHFARRRYEQKMGKAPKNVFGESLFAVSAAAGLRWARNHPSATLVAAIPRYHPWWASSVVHIPGIREVLTWNLALVLRKS